jgi:hypothetical protein
MVEIGTYSAIERADVVTLDLRVRATQFYPNRKMLSCGKESCGYSEYLCTGCGKDFRRVCFTCKSSFCLSCAKAYTDDFVEEVSRVLQSGVRYRHMILTVPEQLRIHFYRDRRGGYYRH